MSRKKAPPMEVYIRHQSGPYALLTFHLNPEQRLELITYLPKPHEATAPAAESSE